MKKRFDNVMGPIRDAEPIVRDAKDDRTPGVSVPRVLGQRPGRQKMVVVQGSITNRHKADGSALAVVSIIPTVTLLVLSCWIIIIIIIIIIIAIFLFS